LERAGAAWNYYSEFTNRSGVVRVDHLEVRLHDGAERHAGSKNSVGAIEVQDAATVVWVEEDPKPRTYQARSIAGPDPPSAAFLGISVRVASPRPLAGDVEPVGLTRVDLTDEFLHQVRARPRRLGVLAAPTDASHERGPGNAGTEG
jgi:hypothetical protein